MVSMASFGAVAEFADMLASLTRIDVPLGKEPRKTRAPSVPCKFWMKMKTLGKLVEVEPPLRSLLSNRRTAPLSKETFVICHSHVRCCWVSLDHRREADVDRHVPFCHDIHERNTCAGRVDGVVCKRKGGVDHNARDDGNRRPDDDKNNPHYCDICVHLSGRRKLKTSRRSFSKITKRETGSLHLLIPDVRGAGPEC